jgi:DNA-binding NarL/FixJ family response regulator
MRAVNLVLAQRNERSHGLLADRLRPEFRNVATAEFPAEIRSAVARLRAPIALVDLELIGLSELKQLCSDFPATAFIAIHRLADDQMWADALAVGAADCCQSNDVHSILFAADRYAVANRSKAAAA